MITEEDFIAHGHHENLKCYMGKRDPQRMATLHQVQHVKDSNIIFIYKKKMINTLYNITWFGYRGITSFLF
jgi:hypothetical protein